MPRDNRTFTHASRLLEDKLGGSVRRGGRDRSDDIDYMRVLSCVCRHFCRGSTPSQIVKEVESDLGITLRREQPYLYLAYAASRGLLSYRPPHDGAAVEKITEFCPWLSEVAVVKTAMFEDVGSHAAEMLVDMCRKLHLEKKKDVVYIGLSGGHALRRTMRSFSRRLRQPIDDMPSKIVFVSLVSGFSVEDPTTDPTSYCLLFRDPAIEMHVKIGFVGLKAQAVIEAKELNHLLEMPGIREGAESVRLVDILLTSGSCWDDEHSLLRKYMQVNAKDDFRKLVKEGCLGDILWRPMSLDGPIVTETRIRALTLLELSDLHSFIAREKSVMLVLGPCGVERCNRPKPEILEAVLGCRQQLITHLVVDSVTAALTVERIDRRARGV